MTVYGHDTYIIVLCMRHNIHDYIALIHLSLTPCLRDRPVYGQSTNSADPDQMPLKAPSDLVLQCCPKNALLEFE